MVKREKINNFNPNNRLKLNQFHQQVDKKKNSVSKQLKKKERDIERLINYEKVDGQIKQEKAEQLKKVREDLDKQKKSFERKKRKQFFMETKYSNIKFIEKKKVTKMLNKVKQSLQSDPKNDKLKEEQQQLVKKLRYILHYPKTVKYVSLFPNTELTTEAIQFQQKIMKEIETKHQKGQQFKNKLELETAKTGDVDKKLKKDDFFIMQ